MGMNLGKFGHHPDPAIDFCVEVDCLIGMEYDARVGLIPKEEFEKRYDRAMDFRVGGDQCAVAAKQALRKLKC